MRFAGSSAICADSLSVSMQFCRSTMEILLATIRPRRSPASEPDAQLLDRYIQRSSRYLPCEQREFASESAFFAHLDRAARRTSPYLVLTDSRGKQMGSEEFATALGSVQDGGAQQFVVRMSRNY